jgi:GNAT superfamily N-acetyltransferase
VHPEHRRRGIGTTLLGSFALRHGWTCDLLETRRDLVLPPDEAVLAAVETDARRAARDYELVGWRDRVPDALLDDRTLLEERMSTDAPHGDLPVGEERWDAHRVREMESLNVARGRTVLSAGAVRNGRLVAFTDLHVLLARAEHARQGATLVLHEHRGHRLGALIKAAALRELATAFPQARRISTFNAEDNAPMVAVNRALGFEPAGQCSTWSTHLPAGRRPA